MDSCSAPSAASLCLLPAALCSAGSGACKHTNQRIEEHEDDKYNVGVLIEIYTELIELYKYFICLTAGSGVAGYPGVYQSG